MPSRVKLLRVRATRLPGQNKPAYPRMSAYLNYDAVINDTYQSHNITGGMAISF